MNKPQIRKAAPKDMQAVVELITELAVYEKAPEQVEITAERLIKDGFGEHPQFYILLVELDAEIIGMAFYYYKYSTWKGRCLYLEDLVVKEEHRKSGVGSLLFEEVIRVAKHEKVKRMEWQVLDWNEPAIKFYNKYNAELDPEWMNGRFYYPELQRFE